MPSENFYPPKSSGGGTGDVVGPASSTDNAVTRFDGVNGKQVQNSLVIIDDSGNVTTPGTVDGRDVSADGVVLDSHVANTSNPHNTTKAQVGLGNVDNTSDANKPVSTAQAAADAAVQAFAIQRANHTGTQLASTISDFTTAAQTAATAAGTDVNTASTLVKRNANKGFAISYTDLDPTTGDPAYAEGRLFYDNAAKTLAYYNNSSNVKLNIGQESYIRVANVTGSIIPNGTVVYITGSSAGLVTVAPAQANALATARAIGVTTEALAATTGVGYVTSYGVVNGLDTSSFTAGARIFLSSTVAGGYTATSPTGTNYATPIGFVNTVNAVTGSIFVDGGLKGQIGRGTANQLRGVNAAATEEENKTLSGTTNEVGVTHGVGTITLGINGTIQTAKGGTSQTTVQGATAQYGGYIRSVKTANYTMVDADWVVADSTAGSFILTLPTMTTGQRFKITDGKRTWGTNPVTLTPPAGQSIASQANGVSLVLNISGGMLEGVYDGTTLSVNSSGSTTVGSASGLSPVAVSANVTTAAVNTMYSCTSTGGFTITLPTIPASGGVIGVMDAGETCSATNFIRVTPATGQSIDGYVANDSILLDYVRANVTLYAAPGATSWKVQYQTTSMISPGLQVGTTSPSAIGAGYIGEYLEGTGVAVTASAGTTTTIASVTLTPGHWELSAWLYIGAVTSLNNVAFGVATATNSQTGWDTLRSSGFISNANASNTHAAIPGYRIIVTTNTTYYLTVSAGAQAPVCNASIRGLRIA